MMEASKVDKQSKRVSLKIGSPTGWRELIVWALVSASIGVAIAFTALLLPFPQRLFSFPLPGGLEGRGGEWYWYEVFSLAAICVLAFIIGLRGRSGTKLILFVLFSATGLTLVIANFESDTQILLTYVIVAAAALLIGVLTFYRNIVAGQVRENFGMQHRGAGNEEDSKVRVTHEEDNK
jgi:hypothetical protein